MRRNSIDCSGVMDPADLGGDVAGLYPHHI